MNVLQIFRVVLRAASTIKMASFAVLTPAVRQVHQLLSILDRNISVEIEPIQHGDHWRRPTRMSARLYRSVAREQSP